MRLGLRIVMAKVSFQHFTRHNDIVYFVGSVGDTGSDKKALWRTDGTADGTYRLTNASKIVRVQLIALMCRAQEFH